MKEYSVRGPDGRQVGKVFETLTEAEERARDLDRKVFGVGEECRAIVRDVTQWRDV